MDCNRLRNNHDGAPCLKKPQAEVIVFVIEKKSLIEIPDALKGLKAP
jgi:hypothetical protein